MNVCCLILFMMPILSEHYWSHLNKWLSFQRNAWWRRNVL